MSFPHSLIVNKNENGKKDEKKCAHSFYELLFYIESTCKSVSYSTRQKPYYMYVLFYYSIHLIVY